MLVIFCSCGEIKPLTLGGIENPKVKSFSKEGVDMTIGVRVKNPNNVAVTVFPSTFDATVNGISVGKVKLKKKVRIKADSDDAPDFHIVSNFSNLSFADMATIGAVALAKKANITLKGDVRAGKWYYKKRFPVDFSKSISIPKL